MPEGEPLNESVARVFDKVFTILGTEERCEGRPQARLRFVKQHVREVHRATIPHLEAFDMRELMGQTSKCGQARIRIETVPRPGICAQAHDVLRFIETRP
jgi:hypothetical protein